MSASPIATRILFIPLKKVYFEQFKAGTKTEEYRTLDERWNAMTCVVGRPVIVSSGYSGERLRGVVSSFAVEREPSKLPGWLECYGDGSGSAAVIGIKLDPQDEEEKTTATE